MLHKLSGTARTSLHFDLHKTSQEARRGCAPASLVMTGHLFVISEIFSFIGKPVSNSLPYLFWLI